MVYDAFGKLVAEYGIEAETTGGVKYVQQDWQGSVRAVTNSNGFVVARTDHQAFGEDIGIGTGLRSVEQGYSADKATRQGYGLTENDQSTGQQHTWWRKLETQAGRWTRPDPYKGSMRLGDPQSFNRYAYVTNDPINFVDPSGLDFYHTGGYTLEQVWDAQLERFRRDGNSRAGHSRGGGGTSSSGRGGGSRRRQEGCNNFAAIVEELARNAADAAAFMQALVNRTIGANEPEPLDASSRSDFDRAQWMGGPGSMTRDLRTNMTMAPIYRFVILWAVYGLDIFMGPCLV